ncbi:sodium-independent sulfate anion transporter isoform X2 [Lepeophtheirus salmonis]|uniref:sodium-independent sulfate anion transporter isoform X2 n=1 Tax=Lepeophtheirus salmonis TaxID=72036 RepID=UPI003AF3947B
MKNVKEEKPTKKNETKKEEIQDMVLNYLGTQVRSVCSEKTLKNKLPILNWLPKYSFEKGISDIIAGFTVGLTVIPQGIAYASVASLPPQYGLYSAFMGCFVYVLLGSSKDITVGPTAIMALMTADHAQLTPDYAVLLTFISGLIILAFGLLQLGFVVDFISVPVIAGFTSAAAITIACTQIKGILGLDIDPNTKSHVEGILGNFIDIFNNIHTFRWQDTLLGLICMILLLLMRSLKNVKCSLNNYPKLNRVLNSLLWILSTGRNALIVVICTVLAFTLDPHPDPNNERNNTFILTGNVEGGLPPFGPPPFSTNSTSHGEDKNMVATLGSAIIIIPLIAILENIAIAKAFASGKQVDANQEMIALGLCNIMGSFVRSMPTTGSFSRTAVNAASGVKTTLGGVYTGVLVILSLIFLMPACQFIPKATLAAVIITAVIFSVEFDVIKPMWRSKKIDLLSTFVTFFCCLFWALEFGILIGVGVSLLLLLYSSARPKVDVELMQIEDIKYLMISPHQALHFPSASYIRNFINEKTLENEEILPVVLNFSRINSTDFTLAKILKSMISEFQKRNQTLIFYETSTSVEKTLYGLNIEGLVCLRSEELLINYLLNIFKYINQSLPINEPVPSSLNV